MTWHTPATQHKTALVLAGGGVTGAIYELGALQALEELLAPSGRTANDFDIFVGTSAGAILGSLLANGIPVETLCQIMADEHPAVRGLRVGDIFKWNSRGLARWGRGLPRLMARALGDSLQQRSLAPLLLALSDAAPPGLYDGAGLARYLSHVFTCLGGSDRFDALARDLYLVATSLNTGQRVVFGPGQPVAATISEAVAASTALPLLYAPVSLGGEWYVDGGLRGNASLDVAIERGARLVVCINPLVPYTGDKSDPTTGVGWRTLRISSHAGLHYHLKHVRRSYPEVDILLIEPGADDARLLNAPLMDFGARQALLEHGRQAVRTHLADNFAHCSALLGRHGFKLRPPAGQGHPEREGASRAGTTTDGQAPGEAIAWPSHTRPGHTGEHKRTRPEAVPVTRAGSR